MNLLSKTLVLLTPAFPPNETAEESPWVPAVQNFVKALNRNFSQLEVIIIAFQFPESKVEYVWNGNLVIPFGGGLKGKLSTLLVGYQIWRALVLIRKGKKIMGIVSFWCAECCLVGSYFSRFYTVNHLCWISGQDAKKSNKLVKIIRPKESELVAMSDFLVSEFYKNHSIKPAYVIPNGVDPEVFPNESFERSIDIIAAGSFISLKRYDLLIDVIAELKSQFSDIKVCLCGDGPEEHQLKNKIDALGLSKNVRFAGLLPHKEVLILMKKSKILIHASEYEGFSNVCIEALYAGAQVISFVQPMQQHIDGWHIVSSKKEMILKTQEVLKTESRISSQPFPFDMNDSVRKFISLLAS